MQINNITYQFADTIACSQILMGVGQEGEQHQSRYTVIHQYLPEQAPGLVQDEVYQDGQHQKHTGQYFRHQRVHEFLLDRFLRVTFEEVVAVHFTFGMFETIRIWLVYTFGDVRVGEVHPVHEYAFIGQIEDVPPLVHQVDFFACVVGYDGKWV